MLPNKVQLATLLDFENVDPNPSLGKTPISQRRCCALLLWHCAQVSASACMLLLRGPYSASPP
eukprot:6469681-Amphidinium_carterae.2